ncbi:MAG: hypothetical protein PHE67_09395 [Campylobacterales bacterium]|nr:hypothetical protein [Campylobacterales bacterium]
MKKTALVITAVFALFVSGCSKKQEPTVAKVETNTTVEKQIAKPAEKVEEPKQATKEVTKTIKKTNVTINSYSECPSFKNNNDYKTIPYE